LVQREYIDELSVSTACSDLGVSFGHPRSY